VSAPLNLIVGQIMILACTNSDDNRLEKNERRSQVK